ncbi:MAG: cupin domain-containing protein [Terracidiphilus sp.]|jgi:quercetin dioxygenase-like cupin family protein
MKTLALTSWFFACAAMSCSAQSAASNALATSRVFAFDELTAKTAPNGAVGRNVFSGTLATGEAVAVHETMQPAGTVPNPEHRIQHSEVIVVEEGTLEFEHDGKAERAGPGSIIYVAVGTLHAIKNMGDGPAKYVVIQIGGDTKK